ncbi:MAG: hypothetical protein ACR2PL_00625 [Dehalococcoidia bacterium]
MILAGLSVVVGLLAGAVVHRFWQRARTGRPCLRNPASIWPVLAVPIVNGKLPQTALETAARLSIAVGGQVVVLVAVQIPRSMSLEAPDPPGLDLALDRLDAAERMVVGLGSRVHGEIVRLRDVSEVAGRCLAETGAQAVVVEAAPRSRAAEDLLRSLTTGKRADDFAVVLAGRHQKT